MSDTFTKSNLGGVNSASQYVLAKHNLDPSKYYEVIYNYFMFHETLVINNKTMEILKSVNLFEDWANNVLPKYKKIAELSEE